MRIQYRARSLADIDDICSYLEKRSPSGASNVLRAIFTGIQSIAENPYSWQMTDDSEIRVKVLHRYSYKIFYAILNHDTVEIIHVRHASRRPWEGGE